MNGMPPLNPASDYPSFGTSNSTPPNPFASAQSLGQAGMGSGPFPYLPPSLQGGAAAPRLGEVVVHVARLLDMPIQEKAFSSDLKQYRVRVFDENRQEIGRTQELAGVLDAMTPEDIDTETLRLGPEGIIRLQTQTPVIYVQVEYAGGFFGNMRIGQCRICRADPRSQEIWPYALSNKQEQLVGCGVELKVLEGSPVSFVGGPPGTGMSMGQSFNTMPGTGMSMGPSFNTMPPSGMSMGQPPTSGPFGTMGPGTPPPGTMQPSFQTVPPLDLMAMQNGKGMGKGLPPPSWGSQPGSRPGTPPMPGPGFGQSFNTMAPGMMPNSGMLQPQMFPNFAGGPGGMPPGSMGMSKAQQTVKQALQGGTALQGGRDVTILLNQLIHANGIFDPTGGSTIENVLGYDEELKVFGFGVQEQHGPGGGTFTNEMPLVFPKGAPPPYNLVTLFQHGAVPPGMMKQHLDSMQTMMPMMPPGTFQMQANQFQVNANVVAIVELDKITDIPAPSGGGEAEVTLTLERVQGGKKMATAGPFTTETQGSLRMVQNCNGKLVAQCNMQDLAQGAVMFRIAVHYKGPFYKLGALQRIGATAPFAVSWKPATAQYVGLLDEPGPDTPGRAKPIGGVTISYRFAQHSDELYKSMLGPASPEEAKAGPRGESGDGMGCSGKFKKGTQDEVLEYAALAVEAQNRALKQRINIAKAAKDIHIERQSQQDNPNALLWRNENGYRDWKNLDSVFITMGPNYVAQSDEMGAAVCRVYEEDTSVLKEITAKGPPLGFGKPFDLEDEAKMRDIIISMYKADPDLIKTTLRPVASKDVSTISREELSAAALKPRLRVKVHHALNLRGKQGFLQGSVNPKVIIEIPGRPTSKWSSTFAYGPVEEEKAAGRWESDAARDGKHVEWNQEGFVEGYSYGDDIKLIVVDKDWIGFEGTLGEARIPGADFYPDSFFAQVPLINASDKGNTTPGPDGKAASIVIEINVLDPLGKADAWPPLPAQYAPLQNLNLSDQQTQRLANWDIHQCAKLAFADVNPNYQRHEDIWGGLECGKALEQSSVGMHNVSDDPEILPVKSKRVKDECLMA